MRYNSEIIYIYLSHLRIEVGDTAAPLRVIPTDSL